MLFPIRHFVFPCKTKDHNRWCRFFPYNNSYSGGYVVPTHGQINRCSTYCLKIPFDNPLCWTYGAQNSYQSNGSSSTTYTERYCPSVKVISPMTVCFLVEDEMKCQGYTDKHNLLLDLQPVKFSPIELEQFTIYTKRHCPLVKLISHVMIRVLVKYYCGVGPMTRKILVN